MQPLRTIDNQKLLVVSKSLLTWGVHPFWVQFIPFLHDQIQHLFIWNVIHMTHTLKNICIDMQQYYIHL